MSRSFFYETSFKKIIRLEAKLIVSLRCFRTIFNFSKNLLVFFHWNIEFFSNVLPILLYRSSAICSNAYIKNSPKEWTKMKFNLICKLVPAVTQTAVSALKESSRLAKLCSLLKILSCILYSHHLLFFNMSCRGCDVFKKINALCWQCQDGFMLLSTFCTSP